MSSAPIPVHVHIMDREYQIACQPGEEETLKASAKYLDAKMREIRDRGNVIGIDRIAVMAALNIAHEYLQLKPLEDERQSLANHISNLRQTISKTLALENTRETGLV
ncbi:MAG TPA: cell division protein ZapA [Gammaproteobacteria bacterium]